MNPLIMYLFQTLNAYPASSPEYQIARGIIVNYRQLDRMTIQQIAEVCGVSVPTLTRYLKQNPARNIKLLKQYSPAFYSHCTRQMLKRISNCLNPENLAKFYALGDYDSMADFLQQETIDRIVKWIHEAESIVVVGSAEIAALFNSFQKNMLLMDKIVYIDLECSRPDFMIKENDLAVICSLTGRIFELNPYLYKTASRFKNRFFISAQDCPDLTLKIAADYNGCQADSLILFYLEYISSLYAQRYGYVSA